MLKAVVDVEQGIMAIGGELHSGVAHSLINSSTHYESEPEVVIVFEPVKATILLKMGVFSALEKREMSSRMVLHAA